MKDETGVRRDLSRATGDPTGEQEAAQGTFGQQTTMDAIDDIRLVERNLYRQDHSAFIESCPEFPRDTRVLHVDYVYTPDERLLLWAEQHREVIKQLSVLYAGHGVGNSERIRQSEEDWSFDTAYTRIPDPENIQQIGVEITKFLSRADSGTDPVILFFDSISVMLQYVSLDTAVQFIEQCLASLEQFAAGGQFYFAPAVHDEETVDVIESLFSE